MRVSPIGWAFESEEEVLTQARKSSEVTHNHPEGIKGAQAVAIAVWLGTKGESKNRIRDKIENYFDYDLSSSVEEIRKNYSFDVSCQGTVPQAIVCFLESEDFEGAVRNAVSLGGDSDTLGCITGSIAEAYYKHIPSEIIEQVKIKLPQRFLDIIKKFYRKYQQ
jgi:ADP-ribosylglycohydrolase